MEIDSNPRHVCLPVILLYPTSISYCTHAAGAIPHSSAYSPRLQLQTLLRIPGCHIMSHTITPPPHYLMLMSYIALELHDTYPFTLSEVLPASELISLISFYCLVALFHGLSQPQDSKLLTIIPITPPSLTSLVTTIRYPTYSFFLTLLEEGLHCPTDLPTGICNMHV